MTITEPDGILTITQTRDCAAYVEYQNYFGKGPGDQFVDMGAFTVTIMKGSGTKPGTMTVYDRASDMTYELTLQEGEIGRACVPWPVMS